ncbi:O-methyltransferase [Brooklawnia cerclae]|uniref:O-methyltransferase YrrM n=1 Tax=Brooklawnia cerclae TaxID=349934 RepID=A0ABX0SGQ9_9ACTN|nr:O-methyltransferase [Brooklawnia cerclae]NIH57089.1 putative O-methyltransferase YrrM [Brooklawnia cerclae]
MYRGEPIWEAVDRLFIDRLVDEDEALVAARESSARTAMPQADVAPNQGAFLSIIARIAGAHRILEFGTLAGYSTIWLARAVGERGRVVTLEVDEVAAAVARENFERAGVADRIDLVLGPALESARALADQGTEPFDMVFIDADKPNNPHYLAAALAMSHPGTVIVGDNVVRDGAVADPDSRDPRVHGTWALLDGLGDRDRLAATALQTVGLKGWDGFAIGVVRGPSD